MFLPKFQFFSQSLQLSPIHPPQSQVSQFSSSFLYSHHYFTSHRQFSPSSMTSMIFGDSNPSSPVSLFSHFLYFFPFFLFPSSHLFATKLPLGFFFTTYLLGLHHPFHSLFCSPFLLHHCPFFPFFPFSLPQSSIHTITTYSLSQFIPFILLFFSFSFFYFCSPFVCFFSYLLKFFVEEF